MDPLRRFVRGLAVGLLVSSPALCSAQQGSVQVSAAVLGVTGDADRLAGQPLLEPDFGVAWLQPGARFGVFQIELRAARRGDTLHTGRLYGALRDLKLRGIAWTLEAGDEYFSRGIGDYRFANLFTPAVTFNGTSVTGRTSRTTMVLVAGKTTAWRNIFGNDPEGLGQSLLVGRVTNQATTRLSVSARASRIRTSSLREFSYTIDASDQVGGGARLALTPSLQLVADGSLVSYRRTGVSTRERDGSYIAGASWLHSRGWLQINASRFSPGDFPALNNPLQDRESVFVAGDYDLWRRVRVSAGWDSFRSNLQPDDSRSSASPTPQSAGSRGFGGVRLQVTSRSAFTLRGESGGRESRPVGFGLYSESDTGSWTGEWLAALGRTNMFVRYSARENVERLNRSGSSDQRDASAQVFASLSQSSQIFGTGLVTRTATGDGGGNTYWQAGGGAQLRVPKRDLWMRVEGTAARNMDMATRTFVPRESLGFGLNGQLSREMTIGLNINVDRSVSPNFGGTPWISRSTLRVTRTLPTGSVYLTNTGIVAASTSGRGTGTISGSVFADWNANGLPDPGENALEGIPLRLGGGGSTTGRDGQFSFLNVPVGMREVGLDTGALPIDFDPPAVTHLDIEISRGDTRRVAFGLIPLGSIEGRIIRDANKNGTADPGEEPIDGAIVVLDGGARSELARNGRYRFDAVRSGAHVIKLLVDSLPEGAVIAGDPEVPAVLSRESMAAGVSFLVSVDKRPEIRRVFPPRGSGAAAAARPPARPPVARSSSTGASPSSAQPSSARIAGAMARTSAVASAVTPAVFGRSDGAGAFTIQIAALNDPLRARDMVDALKATGMPAYLVPPPTSDPDAPYRIRVGPYSTRVAAQETAAALEKSRGEKLWVTKAQ
jgi:cell division septation protein DedD